jgi:hypothetical protein
MNPDVLNIQLRKYLKQVGVTSQREVENAVRKAIDNGELEGNEQIKLQMVLKIERLQLTHIVEDTIALE